MINYVVMASRGWYSDKETWPIAVYSDESSAHKHKNLAQKYALLLEFNGWNFSTIGKEARRQNLSPYQDLQLNPYDSTWSQGTTYSVAEVNNSAQLVDHPSPARADNTGQCSECDHVDNGYNDCDIIENHSNTRNTKARWPCVGSGKPARPKEAEDFDAWKKAYWNYV